MTRRMITFLGPVLTTALLFLAARPAAAGCWTCGSWATPCCPTPPPSPPVGHPCYGYNRTVWRLWPACCGGPQTATLAPPPPSITVLSPMAPPTTPAAAVPAAAPAPRAWAADPAPAPAAPEAPVSPYGVRR